MNGIILIDKEMNYTSHDVVAKLRGIFHQKKIGHTGTLDPQATGLLPICLGNATKVCDLLAEKEKEYIATIRFGITTDTQDIYGAMISEEKSAVTEERFRAVLEKIVGEQEQLTPMFSARKVNGQKLCDLARRGIEIERKTKKITIKETELLAFDYGLQEAVFRVVCSAGTYVRTLCHDMGQELSCGACMSALRRTKTGPFSIENARKIDEVANIVQAFGEESLLISADSLFMHLPKTDVVGEEGKRFLANGNPLRAEHLNQWPDGQFLVYNEGIFTGIYEHKHKSENIAKPVKLFF